MRRRTRRPMRRQRPPLRQSHRRRSPNPAWPTPRASWPSTSRRCSVRAWSNRSSFASRSTFINARQASSPRRHSRSSCIATPPGPPTCEPWWPRARHDSTSTASRSARLPPNTAMLQAWNSSGGVPSSKPRNTRGARQPGLRVVTLVRRGQRHRHVLPSRGRCRSPTRSRPARGLPRVARAQCYPVLPIARTALRGHLSPAERHGTLDRPNQAQHAALAGPAIRARVRRGTLTSPSPSGNLPTQTNGSPRTRRLCR